MSLKELVIGTGENTAAEACYASALINREEGNLISITSVGKLSLEFCFFHFDSQSN